MLVACSTLFHTSIDLTDTHFSVRTDKERLAKLQHVVAKLLEIDVTETDKSDVIQVCIEIGEAYLEAVEKTPAKVLENIPGLLREQERASGELQLVAVQR